MRRIAICALVFVSLLAGPPVARGAGRTSMTYRDGRLSASIVAAPVRQVVDEIGRLSGAAVDGDAALDDEPVSTSFADLPLTNALERVRQREIGDRKSTRLNS